MKSESTKEDITKQKDFSDENIKAIELLNQCIKKGYSIRIDDITLTEYPEQKVISLKPNASLHHSHKEEKKQLQRIMDVGENNDYQTARRAVAELSGVPMMAITFDEHVKVTKEKLSAHKEELEQVRKNERIKIAEQLKQDRLQDFSGKTPKEVIDLLILALTTSS